MHLVLLMIFHPYSVYYDVCAYLCVYVRVCVARVCVARVCGARVGVAGVGVCVCVARARCM